MADVGKVKGDIRPPEPEKEKKKEKYTNEEIKEKWSKVSKVDPDQRKQKKPKAQQEEERKAEFTAPHQGLESQPQPSIYAPQGGIGGGYVAETGEELPSSSPPPYYLETEDVREEEPQKQTEKTRSKKHKKTHAKAPHKKHPIKKKKGIPHAKEKITEKFLEPPKKKVEKKPHEKKYLPVEKDKISKEKEMLEPSKPKKISKEKSKEPHEIPPAPLALGAWEATKKPEKEEEETPLASLPPSPPPTEQVQTQSYTPLQAPFIHLSPQVQQLFEKMVGVMTIMQSSEIQQTTIYLDNPQFANSPFYKTQIIITEFSTAPRAFNIEFLGNPQAVTLFEKNTEELVAAFQSGKYTFSVNRIETGYLSSTAEARRKEARRVKRKKSKE